TQCADANTKMRGTSCEHQHANAKFAEKYHFPFPLLCDTDRKIGVAYGAATSASDPYAKRIAYVIDENGRIQEAHEKVSAGSYPMEQLERLQAAKLLGAWGSPALSPRPSARFSGGGVRRT